MRATLTFVRPQAISIRQLAVLLLGCFTFVAALVAVRFLVAGYSQGQVDAVALCVLIWALGYLPLIWALRRRLWVPPHRFVLNRARRAIIGPHIEIPLTPECNIFEDSWRASFIQFEYTQPPYCRERLALWPGGTEGRNGRAVELLRKMAWRKIVPSDLEAAEKSTRSNARISQAGDSGQNHGTRMPCSV